MNKTDFIAKIAETNDLTKKLAGEVVDMFITGISEALITGEEVSISGFGKFSVTERAARMGINPSTGDTIQIAASKSVKFKVGKALKDSVQ